MGTKLAGLLLPLLFIGCGAGGHEKSDVAKAPVATATPVQPQTPVETGRMVLGPVSVLAPANWEVREKQEGFSIFAPDRPEWATIGFRALITVKKSPHPGAGVTLAKLKDGLDQMLNQSAAKVNELVKNEKVGLKEKIKYSLEQSQIDGAPVLVSAFSGVFQLPTGLVPAETYSIQVLARDGVYGITLAYPGVMREEMDPVWSAFKDGLRIKAEY